MKAMAVVSLLFLTAACGGAQSEAGKAKVTYVTAFGAVGRDAFVWVAAEKGFFAEAGIEADIQKGAGNVQNLTLIRSRRAEFAALDFTGAEIQAGLGAFTNWRAVAAVHQRTLVSVMTTKDTGITKPSDLTFRTVATAEGSVSELLFPTYGKLAGFDPRTVTVRGAQPTALNGLMGQRRVDALSTFLLSRKALEATARKEVVVLPYSDYLPDLYGNAIIARDDVITGDRELVRRFVGAAMKGLQYTIDHPDEAAAILNRAEPTATVPAAVGEITAMTPYVAPLGRLDQQRVTRSIEVLQSNGLMPAGLTADRVADFTFVQ